MKKQFHAALIFLFFIVFTMMIYGCQKEEPQDLPEAAFSKQYLDVHMNEFMELNFWQMETADENYQYIQLLLDNKSSELVRFENNFGVKIYQFNEESRAWEEVENNMNYFGNAIYLAPKGEQFNAPSGQQFISKKVVEVVVNPSMAYYPDSIRVVVVGEVEVKDQSSQKVGAYIDIPLPKPGSKSSHDPVSGSILN